MQCMDELDQPFNDTYCTGVRPADELQCNVMPCDFCSITNCAGQVRIRCSDANRTPNTP